ncbi:MAG TPA: FAD-dependent oxidoreductase [Ilumatobacteraceae bacterium]|nr:FAD-dependent oxidoreductase [Ilumatobacteraceae bacterium]
MGQLISPDDSWLDLMDLHDGTPFWPRRDGIIATHPPLPGDVSCEVCVVGAGITGSLVALELTRRGIDVVVVDRRDAGGGSTSASTSMLQYEIDELMIDLTAAIGWEAAATAYRECSRGIDLVERATQAVGDTCGFRRSPSVFMAVGKRDVAMLRSEMAARADAGFDVRWLSADELMDRWKLVGVAAIESATGGSVDPYQLCYRALQTAIRRGARVHDRTEVTAYELTARRTMLSTNRGTIKARHVVIAAGYEVEPLLPQLPLRLHSSFALVSEPIQGLDRRYPDGLLFWDFDDPYLYGRVTDDERLLIGGRDERYRDPRRRRRALPTKTRALAADAARRFPGAGSIEVGYSWCGTFAETPDGLAYIGGHSSWPRTLFALGFGGNGITYSALAAQYLAEHIESGAVPEAARLFDLERAKVTP